MSWLITFLDSKEELFSSLSESNKLPREPDDSDPDCLRSCNIKEGEILQANTLFLFPNAHGSVRGYHGDANNIFIKSIDKMVHRVQTPAK